jgi:hypothetical protein
MAYVAISDKLIMAVKNKLYSMQCSELHASPRAALTLDETDMTAVEALIWGEDLPLKATMPTKWMRPCKRVDIQFRKSPTEDDMVRYRDEIQCELYRPLNLPPKANNTGRIEGVNMSTNYEGAIAYIEVSADHFTSEKFDVVRASLRTRGEIVVRWEKVTEQVLEFLRNAKSLNEAIKLWPQVAIYIPSEYVAKVEEKRETSKTASRAAEVLGKLDVDAALTSAALARMASSPS